MTLTRRFSQKKNGVRDPPTQKKKPPPKIISKNYFFSILAGGVRALWVSEHPLWRTRYLAKGVGFGGRLGVYEDLGQGLPHRERPRVRTRGGRHQLEGYLRKSQEVIRNIQRYFEQRTQVGPVIHSKIIWWGVQVGPDYISSSATSVHQQQQFISTTVQQFISTTVHQQHAPGSPTFKLIT